MELIVGAVRQDRERVAVAVTGATPAPEGMSLQLAPDELDVGWVAERIAPMRGNDSCALSRGLVCHDVAVAVSTIAAWLRLADAANIDLVALRADVDHEGTPSVDEQMP